MKKIWNVLLATVLGASMLLPVGCGDEETVCKHNVGTWEVTREATCSQAGERSGICGECLQTVKQSIAIDPNAHVYGDWAVQAPTESAVGSAKKTCSACSDVLTQTLPVVSDPSYESSITLRPTPKNDGERTYVLEHTAGDIQFVKPVLRTGIEEVRDAVELGVAEESRALIRRAEGTRGWVYYDGTSSTPTTTPPRSAQSYEFGDRYTYIVDGADKCERWYYYDDEGELVGLSNFDDGNGSDGKIIDDLKGSGNKRYINGSRFYVEYDTSIGEFYGVEDFVEGLYRRARENVNGDFAESIDKSNPDNPVYSFTFGNLRNSGNDSGYFSVYNVQFTLSSEYTVDSLDVSVVTYVNNFAQTPPVRTWALNEEGYAELLPGVETGGTRYHTTINFTQTKKAEGDIVPTHTHTPEKMYVNSYELEYCGTTVNKNDVIRFSANQTTGYVFIIKKVYPETALSTYGFDAFNFYLRTTDKDGKTVEQLLNYETKLDYGISIDTQSQTEGESEVLTFAVNSSLSGDQDIVIRTLQTERVVHCNISSTPPNALYPAVYEYKNTTEVKGEYVWVEPQSNETALEKQVYVNQPFYFTANAPAEQQSYASIAHEIFIGGALANGQLIGATNIDQLVGEEIVRDSRFSATAMGGRPVTQFVTDTAGTYVITLRSTMNEEKMCQIKLRVIAAPSFALLTGLTYYSELEENMVTDVAVSFTDCQEIKEGETVVGYTVTATVTIKDGVEQLTCTYDLAEGSLTSVHSGGVEFGFTLAINEAYDFELSHYSKKFKEWETVVLQKDA